MALALAGVGGFVLTAGVVTAAWDDNQSALWVTAAGGILLLAAGVTSRGRSFASIVGAGLAGAVAYPVAVLIWLTQFYSWP